MRVNPITAEQADEQSIGDPWPAGDYDFTVYEATEGVSGAGNEQVKLVIHIHNRQGQHRTVFDYLSSSPKAQWKVRHFAEAVGMLRQYETGDMPVRDMLARPGRCKVGIEEATSSYAAKNKVLDYIKTHKAGPVDASPPTRKTVPADMDDEIPF